MDWMPQPKVIRSQLMKIKNLRPTMPDFSAMKRPQYWQTFWSKNLNINIMGCCGGGAWDIDFKLRASQVMLQGFIFIGGLMCSIPLGWTTRIFSDNCILYTSMTVLETRNNTFALDTELTTWGGLDMCYYCTYSSVCAAIYSIIWIWFYVLVSDWSKRKTRDGPPPDIRLVLPTLFVTVVLFVCSLVSAGIVTAGTGDWCYSIENNLPGHPCSYISTRDWGNVEAGHLVYTYSCISVGGAWLLVIVLGGQVGLAAFRLHFYQSLLDDLGSSDDSKDYSGSSSYEEEICLGEVELIQTTRNTPRKTSTHSSSTDVMMDSQTEVHFGFQNNYFSDFDDGSTKQIPVRLKRTLSSEDIKRSQNLRRKGVTSLSRSDEDFTSVQHMVERDIFLESLEIDRSEIKSKYHVTDIDAGNANNHNANYNYEMCLISEGEDETINSETKLVHTDVSVC